MDGGAGRGKKRKKKKEKRIERPTHHCAFTVPSSSSVLYGPAMRTGYCEKSHKHCSQLTSLNLQGCSNVAVAALDKLAAGCPHLATLNLFECNNVTDTWLEKIAAVLPHLWR